MEILNLITILLGCAFGCACFVFVGQFVYETIQRSMISKQAMALAIGKTEGDFGETKESGFASGWIA